MMVALLRANNIPIGFCYQRLSCSEYKKDIYCLHGLNAIYLKEYVNAGFNLPSIYEEPLEIVIQTLQQYKTYEEMINNSPDIELGELYNKTLSK